MAPLWRAPSREVLERRRLRAGVGAVERRYFLKSRSRPVFEGFGRVADIDEARDALARFHAERFTNGRMVGVPLGDPIRREAHRVGRDAERLADGARGENLFP